VVTESYQALVQFNRSYTCTMSHYSVFHSNCYGYLSSIAAGTCSYVVFNKMLSYRRETALQGAL